MTAMTEGRKTTLRNTVWSAVILAALLMTIHDGKCSDFSDVTDVTLELNVKGETAAPIVTWQQGIVTPGSTLIGELKIKIPQPAEGKDYAVLIRGPSIENAAGDTTFSGEGFKIETVKQTSVSEVWRKDTTMAAGPLYKKGSEKRYEDLVINFSLDRYDALVPGKYTATMSVQYQEN
ncbi:hypothetical protein J4198_005483 [Salmonella enterica]|nr:hypothetical protein [Salmonella enterica]